jgi:hypothetical protein
MYVLSTSLALTARMKASATSSAFSIHGSKKSDASCSAKKAFAVLGVSLGSWNQVLGRQSAAVHT